MAEQPWCRAYLFLPCCCLVAELCPTLLRPPGLQPARLFYPCCHFLLHGIFLTQGSNPHLLHWEADSLPLSHQRSPPLMLGKYNNGKVFVLNCFLLTRFYNWVSCLWRGFKILFLYWSLKSVSAWSWFC